MRKLASLNKEVDEWMGIESAARSLSELIDIALDDGDFSLYADFSGEVSDLTEKLDQLEFNLMLSGEFDRRNSILAIHSGAGGVESRDWAQMLMRMYLRWSEHRGYKTDILDISHWGYIVVVPLAILLSKSIPIFIDQERERFCIRFMLKYISFSSELGSNPFSNAAHKSSTAS